MEYAKDVIDNLNYCSRLIGQHADDCFSQDVFCEYGDLKIESPIEQLFYTSFKALLGLNFFPNHDSPSVGGEGATMGMLIQPQFKIKTYRVDFYIAWLGYAPMKEGVPIKCVVVECDSQEWHERTEKERRYEKRRDRELATLGLHTFRFTGKEIKENPFRPAIEVCSFLTELPIEDLEESLEVE